MTLPQEVAQASQIQLSITWHEMLSFHAVHFSHDSQLYESAVREDAPCEVENVGFYEDGTERTLTDEQIAMFRHSELQGIIREHRIQLENADDDIFGKKPAKVAPSTLSSLVSGQDIGKGESKRSKDSMTLRKGSTNKKRKRCQAQVYKPDKQDKEKFMHGEEERTFRRICREADEVKSGDVELDY